MPASSRSVTNRVAFVPPCATARDLLRQERESFADLVKELIQTRELTSDLVCHALAVTKRFMCSTDELGPQDRALLARRVRPADARAPLSYSRAARRVRERIQRN